jgi:hypothetical protein
MTHPETSVRGKKYEDDGGAEWILYQRCHFSTCHRKAIPFFKKVVFIP